MTFIGNGIYRIEHSRVPMRIGLTDDSGKDNTNVVGWSVNDDFLDHMWVIEAVPNEVNTYTIRNMVTGAWMDMAAGSNENGTHVIGYHRTGDNQLWIIKKEASGSGFWMIQNKATKTFVDLLYGGTTNGTQVVGWNTVWNDGDPLGNHHWMFSPQSILGAEVCKLVRANPCLKLDFKSFVADGMYLILSQARLQEIWKSSGLENKFYRRQIFDCDDFAFVYKAEVAKWGCSQFQADGFGILCGVMFGISDKGTHAYNWTIKENKIEFFEPQSNTFMDNIGYSAFFGVF